MTPKRTQNGHQNGHFSNHFLILSKFSKILLSIHHFAPHNYRRQSMRDVYKRQLQGHLY